MGNSQNTHKNSQLYNDPAYMDDEKNLKKNLEPEIKKNNFSRKSIKKEPVIKRSNYQKNINYEIISTWNFIEDSEYNLHLLKINSILTNLDKYNNVTRSKNKFEINIDKNTHKMHSVIKSPLNESNISKINQVSILNFQEKSKEKEKPISFLKKMNLEIETHERVSFRDLFGKNEMDILKVDKKPQRLKDSSEKLKDLKNDQIFFTSIYSSDRKYLEQSLAAEQSILKEIENKDSFHSEKGKNLEEVRKKIKYNSLSVRNTPKKKQSGNKNDLNQRSCNCTSKEKVNHIHINLSDLITKDKSNSNFNKFRHFTYKKKEDNFKYNNSYYNSFSYGKSKLQKENVKNKHEQDSSKNKYYPDVNNYDSLRNKNKNNMTKNNNLSHINLSINSNFKTLTFFNDIPQPAQKDNKLCRPENLGLALQNSQNYIPGTGYRAYSEDSDDSDHSN